MSGQDEERRTEAAWDEIVANFGERASLDDPPERPTAGLAEAASTPTSDPALEPAATTDPSPEPEWFRPFADEGRFVPPTPPPLSWPRPWQRSVAWLGVFFAPLLAITLGLLGVAVPPVFTLALVMWFLGGFAYLVATMRSSRDPWDDGSRV